MSTPWPNIVGFFRDLAPTCHAAPGFQRAVCGIADVAEHIERSPLREMLYGWTSIHDLCIQPADREPYSGPFLCISPLHSGDIEFRYVDTGIKARQWHRKVPPTGSVPRLERFLDQVRWVARTSSP